MPFNEHWPRWIHASIQKHFTDRLNPLFIEGTWRDTKELPEFFELRIDGPRVHEASKACWYFHVEINVLVHVVKNDTNFHRIHVRNGQGMAAFTTIPVYRYGNGVDDDQTLVGCLQLIQNPRSRDYLELNQLGQIDINTHILQALIEGHYKMLLNEE